MKLYCPILVWVPWYLVLWGQYWVAIALFSMFLEDARRRRFIFRGLRIKPGFWFWLAASEACHGLVVISFSQYSCGPGFKSDVCDNAAWAAVCMIGISTAAFGIFSNKIAVEDSAS